jgi:hypothetical protein
MCFFIKKNKKKQELNSAVRSEVGTAELKSTQKYLLQQLAK